MNNRSTSQDLDFGTNVPLEQTSEWRNQNQFDY